MEFYARWKMSWSRPVYKDSILMHLSEMEGDILCGIHKRHKGIYEIGFEPIEHIEESEIHICKGCYLVWKKLNNSNIEIRNVFIFLMKC
jgi:hypothetical protein